MSAIEACRTADLGGYVARCDRCQFTSIRYCSCRNRHCPKCQGSQAREWLEARKAELLEVPYFHVVWRQRSTPALLGPCFFAAHHMLRRISPKSTGGPLLPDVSGAFVDVIGGQTTVDENEGGLGGIATVVRQHRDACRVVTGFGRRPMGRLCNKTLAGRTLLKPPARWEAYGYYLRASETYLSFLSTYAAPKLYETRQLLEKSIAVDEG